MRNFKRMTGEMKAQVPAIIAEFADYGISLVLGKGALGYAMFQAGETCSVADLTVCENCGQVELAVPLSVYDTTRCHTCGHDSN